MSTFINYPATPSSGGGGGGVTSVGLSAPSFLSVSGSPVTTYGTLALSLATQSANLVFAGPTTGVAAVPTFRALVGADLPAPSATTLGGVQSAAAVSHQWINSISTAGVPVLSQPAFSDISGMVAASQLPTPTATTLGGVQSAAAVSHQWINSISTSGVPALSQPAFSDISGTASLTTQVTGILPIGNGGTGQTTASAAFNALSPVTTLGDLIYGSAANTSTRLAGNTSSTKQFLTQTGTGSVSAAPAWGTIAATDLPNPTTSSLGGVQAVTAVTSKWVNAISTTGIPSLTQPAFTDISGTASTSQIPSVAGNTSIVKAPTCQIFTSGSGTYTTPTGPSPIYLRVRMVGGGGGGGGGNGGGAGGTGGNTTFGTSLLTANGGAGGSQLTTGANAAGGTASLGTGPIGLAITGSAGSATAYSIAGSNFGFAGGNGGATPFGGAGGGGTPGSTTGQNAAANSGSGGGGGAINGVGNSQAGTGGGAGGFVDAIITSPAASYAYSVGTGGTGGTGGNPGGNGAAGVIIVEEFYQ